MSTLEEPEFTGRGTLSLGLGSEWSFCPVSTPPWTNTSCWTRVPNRGPRLRGLTTDPGHFTGAGRKNQLQSQRDQSMSINET